MVLLPMGERVRRPSLVPCHRLGRGQASPRRGDLVPLPARQHGGSCAWREHVMTEVRAGRTRWAGWVVVAALTLVVVGAVQVVQALVAFFKPSYYYVPASALAVRLDYAAWGWLMLLMEVLMLAAGYGLLAGRRWARMTTVVLAVLSAIANMTFVAAYPWW